MKSWARFNTALVDLTAVKGTNVPLMASSPLHVIQAIYSAYDLNSPFCKFKVNSGKLDMIWDLCLYLYLPSICSTIRFLSRKFLDIKGHPMSRNLSGIKQWQIIRILRRECYHLAVLCLLRLRGKIRTVVLLFLEWYRFRL
jgi:hypothetical protein